MKGLEVEIPKNRMEQMKSTAKLIGKKIYTDLKFANKVQTCSKTNDPLELIIKNNWKP